MTTFLLVLSAERPARAEATAAATPRAASHVARIEGGSVTWESSFVGNESPDPPARWERIELARPISAELDAPRCPGVAAVVDAKGEILSFVIDTERLPDWRGDVRVALRAPLAHVGSNDDTKVVLVPPFARGAGVQRVEVSGEGELRFEPEASSGFVHEVGSWATPGVSEAARHDADALLGGRDTPLDESPIYVDAASAALEHGLRGRALTATQRAQPGLILAISVFALLAAACAAAYRWLARDARLEQAEATLREEYEREARDAR
jgi:hypothetical protein